MYQPCTHMLLYICECMQGPFCPRPLAYHVDSAVKAMVDLIVSDYWVAAGSDLDPGKCVAYTTRQAIIMELY